MGDSGPQTQPILGAGSTLHLISFGRQTPVLDDMSLRPASGLQQNANVSVPRHRKLTTDQGLVQSSTTTT